MTICVGEDARGFAAAILWQGGEGEAVCEAFRRLSAGWRCGVDAASMRF